jgi:hypothetical protein
MPFTRWRFAAVSSSRAREGDAMNARPEPEPLLAGFRMIVHPGTDLVARLPYALLLLRAPAPAQRDLASRLVELCEAHTGDAAPDGHRLVRQVARLLASAEDPEAPAFALVVPSGGRVAVLLHGEVELVVRGADEQRLSGAESAIWVDRIIDAGFVTMDAGPLDGTGTSLAAVGDLRAGVVPGSGWTLSRRAAISQAPSLEAQHEEPAQEPEPVQTTDARITQEVRIGSPDAADPHVPAVEISNVALTFEAVPIFGATTEEKRAPLPTAAQDSGGWSSREPHVSQVQGILCANGHFNDPEALYCRIDGLSLAQWTHDFVTQPRPPLGVIVLDDGSSYSVDGDYVLGREPDRDADVQAGRVRGVVLVDEDDAVSRIHAEIRINGWTPMIKDRGSVNGTYVAAPGHTVWTALTPEQAVPLSPGTRVQLGGRSFVYDSHLTI